jgi:hypothetical protein
VKKLFVSLAICAAGVPMAAVLTFLILPAWRWFEASTGIESLGHSGPATWCFIFVYAISICLGFGVWALASKKRG